MKTRIKNIMYLSKNVLNNFDGIKRYYSTGNINTDKYEEITYDNRPSRANIVAKEGDILIAKMSNTNKTTMVTKEMEQYVFSTGFAVLNSNVLDNRYMFYLLHSKEFIEKKDVFSVGTTQVAINDETLMNIEIEYINDIEKQKKIAEFLDYMIIEIDKDIFRIKETIEDYKKYKDAIIVSLVTRGENHTLKKTNIDWIKEIPNDWKELKISQIFYQVKKKNKGLIEQNLLSLSYGKIVKRNIDANTGLLPDNFEGYNIIQNGDIVLRLTDLQNDHKSLRVGLCNEKGIITSAYITLRLKDNYIPNYFYYLLHSFDIKKGFYGMGSGVRQGLNWEELKDLRIPVPTKKEQHMISNILDRLCKDIDVLIENKEKIVKELELYKKSVIYEYVTGKKEVK